MNRYEGALRWGLKGSRPGWLVASEFWVFIISAVALYMHIVSGRIKTDFFPSGDPDMIFVYLKMPVGTKTETTDSITHVLEKKVYKVVGENNPIVESIISNVAIGATDPFQGERGTQPNLGRIQISFVEYEKRNGESTAPYLGKLRQEIKDIPGAEISISQPNNGPASGPPVNVEV